MLELKKKGIQNAAALLGGTDAWIRAGLPTEPAASSAKPDKAPANSAAPPKKS